MLSTDSVLTLDGRAHPQLPLIISRSIAVVGFSALADPQLSVRETATKAFGAYLSRSPLRQTVKAFGEVIGRLLNGGSAHVGDASVVTGVGTNCGGNGEQLVEAYEAEGQFTLCATLVKLLSTDWLVSHWAAYAPTFERYLAHPASTVRQSASRIFFYLMAKDSEAADHMTATVAAEPEGIGGFCGNLTLASRILASLTNGWAVPLPPIVPFRSPTGKQQQQQQSDLYPPSLASLSSAGASVEGCQMEACLAASDTASHSWEWKEGRLLAYELVLNCLLNDHTLKLFPTLAQTLSPKALPSPIIVSSPASGGGTSPSLPISPLKQQPLVVPGSAQKPPIPGTPPFRGGSPPGASETPIDETAPHASLIDRLRHSPAFHTDGGGDWVPPASQQVHPVQLWPGGDGCCTAGAETQVQLRAILLHTTVCFADARWEVRRMAEQVLSALTEALCWFDVERLRELWVEMSRPTSCTLVVYVACLALRHALRKCQVFRASLLPALASSRMDGGSHHRVLAVIDSVNKCLTR